MTWVTRVTGQKEDKKEKEEEEKEEKENCCGRNRRESKALQEVRADLKMIFLTENKCKIHFIYILILSLVKKIVETGG